MWKESEKGKERGTQDFFPKDGVHGLGGTK